MNKISALILALVAQSTFAAGATPESTAAHLRGPTKAVDVAKDPKAAVTAIILMQKGMDPGTYTNMAQAGMSPDVLKSYAAIPDPNMYMMWLMSPLDPRVLQMGMALLNPNIYTQLAAPMTPADMLRLMAPMNPNPYNPYSQWMTAPVTPITIGPNGLVWDNQPGVNRLKQISNEIILTRHLVATSRGPAYDLTGVEQYVANSRQEIATALDQSPELSALKRYYELNVPTEETLRAQAYTSDGDARKLVSVERVSKLRNFLDTIAEYIRTKPETDLAVVSIPDKAVVTIKSLSIKREGTTNTSVPLYRGLYSYTVEKTGFKPIKAEDALDLVAFSGNLHCELVANEAQDSPRPCNFIKSK